MPYCVTALIFSPLSLLSYIHDAPFNFSNYISPVFDIHAARHVFTRCLEIQFLASNRSPTAVSTLEESLFKCLNRDFRGTFWNESGSYVVHESQKREVSSSCEVN